MITGRLYYEDGGSSRTNRSMILSLHRPRISMKRLPVLFCGCHGGFIRRSKPQYIWMDCKKHGITLTKENP